MTWLKVPATSIAQNRGGEYTAEKQEVGEKKKMGRQLSRAERKKAFLAQAEAMFEELEGWYDQHPEATFGEIEQEARRERRKMMGKVLEVIVNGRDTGKQETSPICQACGQPLSFKGYRRKWVQGLEGDSQLERAYYVCPNCKGETLFPPR
jgi:formate dehydrogenase maturation protein FdhE